MKVLRLISLAPVLLLLPIGSGGAADATGAGAELDSVVAKIQTRLRAGNKTEAEVDAELKEFDVLAIKYGVDSLPDHFLLDGQGKILARNLRGQQLGDAALLALGQRAPPPKNPNTREP
jgi:hypothetical protein